MKLIGSRLLGLNRPNSDYDFAELTDAPGTTYRDIINDHFERMKHCYYIPKAYMQKVINFEIVEPEDIYWVFLAEDFIIGLITENPFDSRDKWIEKLKNVDLHNPYFYTASHDIYKKRCYHLMFNLECLRQNTLSPTMERVKAVYEHKYSQKEFEKIMEERFDLK